MATAETITHTMNSEKNRFEFELEDGKMGIVKFRPHGKTLKLIHTQVPAEIRGQGYGSEMVKQTLEDIEEMYYKVVPLCPFVSNYMDEHSEFDHLRYKA